MTSYTRIYTCVLSFILISMSAEVLAWSGTGHETVAAIAARLLEGTEAESQIHRILHEDESLMTISVWADCVKHPQAGVCNTDSDAHKEEWSGFLRKVGKENATNYHFADVDIKSTGYIYNQNQQQEDVVRGIREAIGKLSEDSGAANPNNLNRREALWLLAHLLGDIHQPLHIGVIAIGGDIKATLGGNWLYPNASSCLHAKWDVDYVAAAMKRSRTDSSEEYADYILEKHPRRNLPKTNGAIIDWPVAWANETLAVAREQALDNVNIGDAMNGTCGYHSSHAGWKVKLPKGYAKAAAVTAEEQLWKAGVRLADTLNAIWP